MASARRSTASASTSSPCAARRESGGRGRAGRGGGRPWASPLAPHCTTARHGSALHDRRAAARRPGQSSTHLLGEQGAQGVECDTHSHICGPQRTLLARQRPPERRLRLLRRTGRRGAERRKLGGRAAARGWSAQLPAPPLARGAAPSWRPRHGGLQEARGGAGRDGRQAGHSVAQRKPRLQVACRQERFSIVVPGDERGRGVRPEGRLIYRCGMRRGTREREGMANRQRVESGGWAAAARRLHRAASRAAGSIDDRRRGRRAPATSCCRACSRPGGPRPAPPSSARLLLWVVKNMTA